MKSYCITLFFLFALSTYGNSQNVNVSNGSIFEGEPCMAIDPNNPQHIIAVWMGFKLGQGIIIKTKYSDDGGITWSTVVEIPSVPGANAMADPSIEYDSNGNVFICYINHENVNFSQGSIYVRKSTDGGATWGPNVEAISILDCPDKLCVDRPWIAIDNSTGPNNGAIYVTAINANQPSIVIPPYHSYLAVSSDGGASFANPRFVDTIGYNVGVVANAATSPVVSSNGTFHATYPSFDTSQNPFAHIYLASSTTLGVDIDHANAYTVLMPPTSDPYAKKASKLISDPSDPNHLALLLLGAQNGDGDVYFLETYDLLNWTTPARINDDPIGNGKLQDLMWGDFNENGDLAICWRDRRNGAVDGYQTETEIYGALRYKDSVNFEVNFPISSEQVPHNIVLEDAGNDFMNVRFIGDTIYSIWGDVRTGTLNIFLNKTSVSSGTSSTQSIHSEDNLMSIFPNPANDYFKIDQFEAYQNCQLIDASGTILRNIETEKVSTSGIPSGTYFVRFEIGNKAFTASVVVQH